MRETRQSGSEGGGTGSAGPPYPYHHPNASGPTVGTRRSLLHRRASVVVLSPTKKGAGQAAGPGGAR